MQWQLLFLSIAPLVAFMGFVVSGRRRAGVIAAVVVAAMELAYNSVRLGFLEPFSLLSAALYGGFGAWSLRVDDERPFKLQPVVFEICAAGALVYYDVVLDTPLLAIILKDHVGLHDALEPYQRGYATVYATTLSRSLPFVLVLHAALTARAAWARSTWCWFNVRVFGLYLMVGLLFLAERMLGITP